MSEVIQELELSNQQHTGEVSRREKRMSRRRREILEVAARLFSSVGYEETTLEMIADELGLSKPGLYYYIRSKEDVLVQLHGDVIQSIINRVQANISQQMTPDERLRRLIVAHTISLCSHPARRILVLYRSHLFREQAQDVVVLRDQYQKIVEDIIAEGIQQGIFHVSDAKMATFAVLGALNWIPGWYSPDGPLSLEAVGEYFANILVGGLIKPTGSS